VAEKSVSRDFQNVEKFESSDPCFHFALSSRRYGPRDKLLRKIVRGILDREEGMAEPTSQELEKWMLYWEYGVVFKDDDSGYETGTGESSS
jgi:hypothetical protein